MHYKKKLWWREPNDVGVGKFLLPCSLVFCATIVNIGIWRISTWLFFTVCAQKSEVTNTESIQICHFYHEYG
jgi:hypothetical protein